MTWVFNHSPYTLGTRLVHLALADWANDGHDWQVWATQARIAEKAKVSVRTVSTALATMVADGYLELVDGSSSSGMAVRYKFLRPEASAISADVDNADCRGGPATPAGGVLQNAESHCLLTQIEPKENMTGDAVAVATPESQLCALLADSIAAYRVDGTRPPITKTWLNDMRLLVERGPLHVERAAALPPERIEAAIRFTFTHLAVRTGSRGFCWAAQIRSPGALRDHWHQLLEAGRHVREQSVDPLDQALAGIR